MLGFTDATAAKARVTAALERHEQSSKQLLCQCEALNTQRVDVGRNVIADFETFINKLAQSPKSYERAVALYRVNLTSLQEQGQQFREQMDEAIRQAAVGGGATAGLGAAAGAATAFGAPSAAMAVAMTFGTASTGTAISSLTGAVATKAALAWLGGGALAAGGGGVAGGAALLTLAGPVGMALAAGSALAGMAYARIKNSQTIEEASEACTSLTQSTDQSERALTEVCGLYELTVDHTRSLRQMLTAFEADAPRDYLAFTAAQKNLLGAMHNNVLALARLLKVTPGEVADLTKPVDDSELNPTQQSGPDYKPNFMTMAEVEQMTAVEKVALLRELQTPGKKTISLKLKPRNADAH